MWSGSCAVSGKGVVLIAELATPPDSLLPPGADLNEFYEAHQSVNDGR